MIGLLGSPPQELLGRADKAAYSGLYTAKGMHDSSSGLGARDPVANVADHMSSAQANLDIHNSFLLKAFPFRISRRPSAERTNVYSSHSHVRCSDGFQRSDPQRENYTKILG
jgi:hypothetical protein